MALVNKPQLLIADEPTTALDVTILKNELGMSILFITHDLGLVQQFSDHVCVMKDGIIVEQGVTSDVFNNPNHEYTKRLLDAEPKPKETSVTSKNPIIQVENFCKRCFIQNI